MDPERVARWRESGGKWKPGPVMVWTPQQTGTFLDAIEGDRLYPLYALAAFAGLRRAELAGLPWSETDLDAGLITVRETRPDDDADPNDPKSEAGSRTVALSADTAALLRAWRKRQLEERLAWGEAWTDSGLVFTKEDGQPLRPAYLSEHFGMLVRKAALPPIRFHDLRHGSATLSQVSGVAAAASFGESGERTLPAVQRAALEQARSHGSPGTLRDLGCHHPLASDRTMMQPVTLQRIPA